MKVGTRWEFKEAIVYRGEDFDGGGCLSRGFYVFLWEERGYISFFICFYSRKVVISYLVGRRW